MRELKTTAEEWDLRFYRIAMEVGGWSKDPDKQVGALIVSPDRRKMSPGYNGLPPGMADDPMLLCNKEEKNRYMAHAEVNALDNALCDVTGSTLYVTCAPCLACAGRLVTRGIRRVVSAPIDPASRWSKDQHDGCRLLEGAGGVAVNYLRSEHV